MKYYLISLLLCFSPIISVYGQKYLPGRPFERIIFSELTPKWHVISSDNKFVGDTCDAYNSFNRPLLLSDLSFIDGNSLYTIYYRVIPSVKAGTYIEKRDLSNGNLIWQTYYGWPMDTHREFGRKMYINTKGNLEVIGNISNLPYAYNQVMSNNHFSLREYNAQTGALIQFEFKDFADTSALTMFFNPDFHKALISNSSEGFILIDKLPLPNLEYDYYTFNAKYDANQQDVDTFKLRTKMFPCDQAPIQLSDSLFLLVEFDMNNILFRYVDHHLKVVSEFTSEGDFNFLRLIAKDVENQIYFFADVRGFFDNNRVLCYDGKANLLKLTHIQQNNKGSLNVLDWANKARPLFLQPRNRYLPNGRAYAALDLLKSNSKDSLELVKTFVATDSLRTVDLMEIKYINNGLDVLINWRERASYYDENNYLVIDDAATAYGLILFDRNEFEKYLTSVSEISPSSFSIYPNPTSDLVHLNFQQEITGTIKVMDIHGQEVLREKLLSVDRISISTLSLQKGIYFVDIIDQYGRLIFNSQKFVKL